MSKTVTRGALAAALALLVVAVPAQTAAGAPLCPADVWLTAGGSGPSAPTLQRFTVDPATGALTLAASYPIAEPYGDIAMAPDESALYGVNFVSPPEDNALVLLDQTSGAELDRVTLAPMTPSEGLASALNSLSYTPDGRIYVGSNLTTNLFIVDPDDGTSTQPTPSTLPTLADGTLLYSAGDFLTLADGDLLAVTINTTLPTPTTYLSRIDLDNGTGSVVAHLDGYIFGAAQSGGRIYLAADSGVVYSLNTVPSGTDETYDIAPQLDVAWVGDGTPWWGATSGEDATATCWSAGPTPTPTPSATPGPQLAHSGTALLGLGVIGIGLAAIGAAAIVTAHRHRARRAD